MEMVSCFVHDVFDLFYYKIVARGLLTGANLGHYRPSPPAKKVLIMYNIAYFCKNIKLLYMKTGDTMRTGQLLKFYRELRNLSPETLADVIGLDYRTYLKIENGARDLKVPELLKISEQLEITPDKLLTPESTINSFSNFTSNSSCIGNNYSNIISVNEELLKSIHEVLKQISDKLK